MIKLRILIAIILVVSISSCKKNARKITTSIEEINLLDTLTLKLNNGKKWVANNATQIGILKMDSIITAFNKGDKKNYSNLGKDLSIQTSFIIRSCNMTGEAHDQLHVVLVPMLDEISALKELENKEEGEIVLLKLEDLIAEYFNHFEN